MKEIITKKALDTIELGYRIGRSLKKGDVLLLDGDLGAGKTTFTKGIGQALHVKQIINSPTFTIMKMYQGDIDLYHFDLYRLDGEGMDFDLEEYIYGDAISVIEWPNQALELIPDAYLYIRITRIDDDDRLFQFEAHGERYERILEVI